MNQEITIRVITRAPLPFGTVIENNSDEYFERVLVKFPNSYALSVVTGEYAYVNKDEPYEIAVLNKSGDLDGSLLDDANQGDDVLGCCDADKVRYYLDKVSKL